MGYHGIYWASMEPSWAKARAIAPSHGNSSLTTAALKEWLSKDGWQ
jgi:hypothetical protein